MKCFICGIDIESLVFIRKHFRLAHNLNEKDTYKCTYRDKCNRCLKSLSTLVRHVQAHIMKDNASQEQNTEKKTDTTNFSDFEAPSTSSSSEANLSLLIPSSDVINIDEMLECLNEPKEESNEIKGTFLALKLHSKNNFSRKDVIEIKDSIMENIVHPLVSSVKQFIQTNYVPKNSDGLDQRLLLISFIESISSPFNDCKNEYQLFKWLVQNDYTQNFKEFVVSKEIAEKFSRGVVQYEEIDVTGVLLPLSFQFRKFFEKNDQLLQTLKSLENISSKSQFNYDANLISNATIDNVEHTAHSSCNFLNFCKENNTSFICHQLNSQHGCDEGLIELASLLSSWNLGDLYDFFVQQHLYVPVLKHLSKEMARKLFKNTNVPLSARVEFVYQWSNWMESSNKSTPTYFNTNNNPLSNPKNQTIGVIEKQLSKGKSCINLTDILNSNSFGKSVMESYKKEKSLNENLRKLLVESIVQFCAVNDQDLSISDCASISTQICEAFPEELASYYFVERKNGAPLGKLYNKYRNWKYSISRKTNEKEYGSKKQKVMTFEVIEDENDNITKLKNYQDSMTYEEKLSQWSGCVATRMNNIRKMDSTSKHIIQIWPQYKSPDGFRLIDSDFKFLFGEKNILQENLSRFSHLMLEKVFPNRASEFSKADFDLFQKVNKEKINLTEDSINIAVFMLLQSLLPRSRKYKVSANKTKFYSLRDSRESFMVICGSEIEYKQMYDSKVKAESSVPPFTSAIGTLEDPRYFMVDFENIAFKFFSFAKAIDTCFKAYKVFNIAYAEPCCEMWDFINLQFYNVEINNKLKPAIDALLNEIKLSYETN